MKDILLRKIGLVLIPIIAGCGPRDTVTVRVDEVEETLCSGGDNVVVLIVDPRVNDGIREAGFQFADDLCAEGYRVIQRSSDFPSAGEVRAYLQSLYQTTGGLLAGAILIGKVPYAYQDVRYSDGTHLEAISMQFYSDLDGIFETSPGYVSPAGHADSYDVHDGPVDWEIWVGVLPLYRGDPSASIDAINSYLARNHAYRAGETSLPRRFVHISEFYCQGCTHPPPTTLEEHQTLVEELCCGSYAWTPMSNAPDALFYFDSPPAGLTIDQGYAALGDGVADFFDAGTHGTWAAAGRITSSWVDGHDVRTFFFWSGGCNVANLDHADNILTELLYSPTSMILFAKGATQLSGGMGTNEQGFFGHNIALGLVEGKPVGEAIIEHVNVPLVWPWSADREMHTAVPIFLGDPTLRLSAFYPGCRTTISGTVTVAGAGAPGVMISATRAGSSELGALSNVDGWFQLQVPPEAVAADWTVTAQLPGYTGRSTTVTVTPCTAATVDLAL